MEKSIIRTIEDEVDISDIDWDEMFYEINRDAMNKVSYINSQFLLLKLSCIFYLQFDNRKLNEDRISKDYRKKLQDNLSGLKSGILWDVHIYDRYIQKFENATEDEITKMSDSSKSTDFEKKYQTIKRDVVNEVYRWTNFCVVAVYLSHFFSAKSLMISNFFSLVSLRMNLDLVRGVAGV